MKHIYPGEVVTFRPGLLDPALLRRRQQEMNERAAALRAAAEARFRTADIEIPMPPDDACSFHYSGPLRMDAPDCADAQDDDPLRAARGIINGLFLSAGMMAIVVFLAFVLRGWF